MSDETTRRNAVLDKFLAQRGDEPSKLEFILEGPIAGCRCGSRDLQIQHADDGCRVECQECGICGPWADSPADANSVWQSIAEERNRLLLDLNMARNALKADPLLREKAELEEKARLGGTKEELLEGARLRQDLFDYLTSNDDRRRTGGNHEPEGKENGEGKN